MIIACVLKTGVHNNQGKITEYTPNVVQWLKRQCEKFVTVPFEFVCLTDLDEIDGVKTIKLKHNFPNWWSKIELFRPDIFQGKKVFYMDLDTVLIDNIDNILNYPHKFTVLSQMSAFAHTPSTHLIGSGVMAWDMDLSGLYRIFCADPEKYMDEKTQTYDNWGDQGFIQRHIQGTERFQKLFPNQIVSFPAELRKGDPKKGNKIIVFHGKPKPHEITRDWIMKI